MGIMNDINLPEEDSMHEENKAEIQVAVESSARVDSEVRRRVADYIPRPSEGKTQYIERKLGIGPDWKHCLSTLVLITIVESLVTTYIYRKHRSLLTVAVSATFCILQGFAILMTALKDPGPSPEIVVSSEERSPTLRRAEELYFNPSNYCQRCNWSIQGKIGHFKCFGKCLGQGNLIEAMISGVLLVGYFIYSALLYFVFE
eukprot:TRINITY_DN12739_c0_g1_i1.p1 TRINITY_DN12739_c0_g1~~TRINITY_DN12739_c0_g1_i1.p1  ORF type:complete len:202 (+),score=2.68 TRINITY_DN12739_c0_g1_i1:100-705(+)